MKSFYALASAALLASSALALPAMAETKAAEFAQQATIAGKFEIESSKLAVQRTKDKDVKTFAQKMITDHTKADKELKNTLHKANLSTTDLSSKLDEKHQKELDELKAASAEEFDEKYIDAQQDAHEDAVSLFKNYAEEGDNESLKKYAANTLPHLEEHKTLIDGIEKAKDDQEDKSMAADKKDASESKTDKPAQ